MLSLKLLGMIKAISPSGPERMVMHLRISFIPMVLTKMSARSTTFSSRTVVFIVGWQRSAWQVKRPNIFARVMAGRILPFHPMNTNPTIMAMWPRRPKSTAKTRRSASTPGKKSSSSDPYTNENGSSLQGYRFWWCRQESNRRHMDFQSIALPPELRHHRFGNAKVRKNSIHPNF